MARKRETEARALYRKFAEQPAQLSMDEVKMMAAQLIPDGYAVAIRLALFIQGKSGRELIDMATTKGREGAEAAAYFVAAADDAIAYLKSLTELVESARCRSVLSMVEREDMQEVIAAGKAQRAAEVAEADA